MKKYLLLSLIAVILLTAVSGSIAYFTDSVSVSNTIASGSIKITQHEYERAKNADGSITLQSYSPNQTIYPCVMNNPQRTAFDVNDYQAQLYSSGINNFVDKIVAVENIGQNHASVRTYVAVPTRSSASWLHLDKNTDVNSGWVWHNDKVMPNQEIETEVNNKVTKEVYDIHVATYEKPLAPGEITPPSLLGFYLDDKFTNKNDRYIFTSGNTTYDLGTDPTLYILVASEATQAIGFTGNEDPMNKVFDDAYDALDTVFGAPGEHHPWDANSLSLLQQNPDTTAMEFGTNSAPSSQGGETL